MQITTYILQPVFFPPELLLSYLIVCLTNLAKPSTTMMKKNGARGSPYLNPFYKYKLCCRSFHEPRRKLLMILDIFLST